MRGFQVVAFHVPFRADLRLEGCGDVVDLDSSEGRDDGL